MEKSTFYIVGKHPVIEALKNPSRKVLRVFLNEDSKKRLINENSGYNLLKNIRIFYKSNKELDKYCHKDQLSHQGYVAEIEHIESPSIKEFLSKNSNRNNINLVALEEVTDPRNIGSIIRSAASFDIDGIIVKDRHFPDESKIMYKSASGCVEHTNIFKVSNINTTLKYLREKNFWIYGFDSKSQKDFTKIKWSGNIVLLFGSEGYGISKHTEKYSDFLVKININNKIESLNISNCASIVFHYINTNK